MALFNRKDYSEDLELIKKELESQKDYSEELEQIRKEIQTQSDKGLVKQQELENGIIRLTQEVTEMKSFIKDVQTMLVNITDNMENMSHVSMTFVTEEEAADGENDSPKVEKGAPIYKHKRYPHFKKPRHYDIELAKFYSMGGNGAKRYFDLNFRQLVSIIKGCQNGLNVKELMINPILQDFTYSNLLNYTYIWRAGGFNSAIEDVARELGFNPKKLISHECDSNGL